MGTRHLICVVKDGAYKVAQYGQWDGYPSGQGVDILDILNSESFDLEVFRKKVDQVHWITDEEIAVVEASKNWTKEYPYLNRDCGADILTHIFLADESLALANNIRFAGESSCEWVYVIDLDNDTLEVYEGYNHNELNENDRFFAYTQNDERCFPVKLKKAYDLHKLPSNEQFIAELETGE